MKTLVLELFSEEIPVAVQKEAETRIRALCCKVFKPLREFVLRNHADYSEEQVGWCYNDQTDWHVHVGPRRVTVILKGYAGDIVCKSDMTGPLINGNNEEAKLNEFCRKVSDKYYHEITREDLSKKERDGREYWYCDKEIVVSIAKDMLPRILPTLIESITWPGCKSIEIDSINWVRPLRNILCILDDKVVEFECKGLKSNDKTFGNRCLGSLEIKISKTEEYETELKKSLVIISKTDRESIIRSALEKELIPQDIFHLFNREPYASEVIEEVIGLAEYPSVLLGKIASELYSSIPYELIMTTLRQHQKCVPMPQRENPRFIFIANGQYDDNHKNSVIAGYEKVVNARLLDAKYLYDRDLEDKAGCKSRLEKLKTVVFDNQLGTMADKQRRIIALAKKVAPKYVELHQAAELCKNALFSHVVREFPELEYVMAAQYAAVEGGNDSMVNCIQYCELFDSLDSVVGLLLIGKGPTATSDRYGVKRYGYNIAKHIMQSSQSRHNIENLSELIDYSIELFKIPVEQSRSSPEEIKQFIKARIIHWISNGRLDARDAKIIGAVLDLEKPHFIVADLDGNLMDVIQAVKGLLDIYNRVLGVLKSSEIVDASSGNIKKEELKNIKAKIANFEVKFIAEEKELYSKINSVPEYFCLTSTCEHLTNQIKPAIEQFLDNHHVNHEDPEARSRRISLMVYALSAFHELADFSILR